MLMNPDALALSANFIATFACGLCIIYFISSRKIGKHPFYVLWAFGFVFYASEILARILCKNNDLIIIALLFGTFFSFSSGLWYLNRRKSFLATLVCTYFLIFLFALVWSLTDLMSLDFGKIAGFVIIYGGVTSLLFCHRLIFGRVADRFIIGWSFLFLSNIILPLGSWIVDVFAIFSKFVLLIGIVDQDFVVLTQKIQREMVPHSIPYDSGFGKEGKLTLIIPQHNLSNIEWTIRKVRENVEKNTNTYIFSFQDVVPYSELRRMKWTNPEIVFIFLFSSSAENAKKEFAVLPMGITKVGATLSEVIKKQSHSEKSGTIVLMNLSLLINIFGTFEVYNMILDKRGALRERRVDLFAFLHPETHGDKSIVPLFANISDQVIKL